MKYLKFFATAAVPPGIMFCVFCWRAINRDFFLGAVYAHDALPLDTLSFRRTLT
jgi:hypothetical protein